MLLFHMNRLTGARVPPNTGIALLHGERAKAAQFNPVTARHRVGDLLKDRVDDPLYIPLIQVWVFVCNLLNQFRTDHAYGPPKAAYLCRCDIKDALTIGRKPFYANRLERGSAGK